MKKTIMSVVFVCLVACTTTTKQNDSERKEQYITTTRGGYVINLCDAENMPQYSKRPKVTRKELSSLNVEQMDARIQAHLLALDSYIDNLESVIDKTRQRVERCR